MSHNISFGDLFQRHKNNPILSIDDWHFPANSEGWLILYHGVRRTAGTVIYRLGLALLDLENPDRLLRRSEDWIFGPGESYEDDVVFPCGWIIETEIVPMYHGDADFRISFATVKLSDLRDYITHCPQVDSIYGWR